MDGLDSLAAHSVNDEEWAGLEEAPLDVSQYPRFEYSNKEVKRAGEMIASNIPWTDESAPEIRKAFLIANNWRDAHAYPMRSLRYSVIYYMRQAGLAGITAARLKRMQAIRGKLRRIKLNLNQLQDLGGCRVILPNIADVQTLTLILRNNVRHDIKAENNYIAGPKEDGYRSHHLIFSFFSRGSDTAIYDGRRIELQVRTRLQHAWATAIEAVGLFRGEQLKNHQGSEAWLRLFKLMSAEFAEAECCPLPPGTPDQVERRQELRQLAKSLDAVSVLESVSHGFNGPDLPLVPGYRPTHYLIRYDRAAKTVHVEPHSKPVNATQSYDSAEASDNRTGKETQNVVLVEVDKIENLKDAYPNYFGDVELFKSQLRAITLGESAVEYSSPPRQIRKQSPVEKIDPSWLRRTRFPRPSSGGKK